MKPAPLVLVLVLSWLAAPDVAHASEAGASYDQAVLPFLAKHCTGCHGPEVEESNLRLDMLPADVSAGAGGRTWAKVLKQLQRGKMPPEDEPRPAPDEVAAVVDWIDAAMRREATARRLGEGRSLLRRLNRSQYENSVRDLLAIDIDLKADLPEDNSAHGFDTVAESLNLSSVLLERYIEAADTALDAAIVHTPRPESRTRRFRLQDEKGFVDNTKIHIIRDDAAINFAPGPTIVQALTMVQKAVEPGRYRVRISAYGYQTDKPFTIGVYGGDVTGQFGQAHLIGFHDLPPGAPALIAFEDRMQPRDSFKFLPYRLTNGIYQGRATTAENYRGPGLAVQWVEVEGPLSGEPWPPESHRRLFGDLPLRRIAGATTVAGGLTDAVAARRRLPVGRNRVPAMEVASDDPRGDAERLLRRFVPRAFRRPVGDAEVRPFVALVRDRLDAGYGFEEAMRVGFKAVLCAPEFLFFHENPGRLDDFALASRLAYFLGSTPPDEALLAHAHAGELSRPEILRAEADRLLDDPKAHRFTTDFVGQWLDLRQIDATTPDPKRYPEFDELLQVSMVRETELFFEELLARDLSVRNLIDSDFAMLNERLARHYGIPSVVGQEFRRVALPPGSHRGGVLTQASVLKVTANGTNTSPVLRGVWVLDNLLGEPPQPPPPNVPAVEPDLRGATTIRAQLARHRSVASCASCHNAIDPPGFALESYDVVGGWRDAYQLRVERQLPKGMSSVEYRRGAAVDAGDVLPDGRRFRDLDEFKKLLLDDVDRVIACVAEKLLVYATGAPIEPSDRPAIDAIVRRVATHDAGLRSLIHEVIQSDLFRTK